MSQSELKEAVRERYAGVAQSVLQTGKTTGCCGSGGTDCITQDLYGDSELNGIPRAAASASLGCGNPTALIDLHEGETVLDLGSGGGIDVLLSAKRVGPTGFAYGVDMTDEMLELARKNQTESGLRNVEFLKGSIEAIPLPEGKVDVVISNCVINLSTDKKKTLGEAFRVLRPGGRFAVSDVVQVGQVDPSLKDQIDAYVGCIAGAITLVEYRGLLESVGFTNIEIQITRRYSAADVGCCGGAADAEGPYASAFIRASKPA